MCRRKLQSDVDFEPLERYDALARVDRTLGLADKAEWLNGRIQALRAG